ncbi:DUF4765 family protein [Streptomyces cucumeris]|uniref:DUF4765 family protein n=1 Tax=Streptomyces cucumeris TaxID=2962890 RepID=UPI003D74ADAA
MSDGRGSRRSRSATVSVLALALLGAGSGAAMAAEGAATDAPAAVNSTQVSGADAPDGGISAGTPLSREKRACTCDPAYQRASEAELERTHPGLQTARTVLGVLGALVVGPEGDIAPEGSAPAAEAAGGRAVEGSEGSEGSAPTADNTARTSEDPVTAAGGSASASGASTATASGSTPVEVDGVVPLESWKGAQVGDTSAAGNPTATTPEVSYTIVNDGSSTPSTEVAPERITTRLLDPSDEDYVEGVEQDDFDRYKDGLPQPTSEEDVAAAVDQGADTTVTLWRGTSNAEAEAMVKNSSASGEPASADTPRPTREEARAQVGTGKGIKDASGTVKKLREFTTERGVADSFSSYKDNSLVVADISARYLTKGSGSEGGWVANPTAPAKVRAVVVRPFTLKPMGNAS